MNDVILDKGKDPLGRMMLDYLEGKSDAWLDVESSTLDMSTMSASVMFRQYAEMSLIEQKALELCKGWILDVGAGSGCHSLYLQERKENVVSLDISPGCVEVLRKRKLQHVVHQNLFSLCGEKYDTILMLMNGLGLCGTLDGLNHFFHFLPEILEEGGQLLADSTDLTALYHQAAEEGYIPESYFGETEFVMRYNTIVSAPFRWLYVDYETLNHTAKQYGMRCELLLSEEDGQYLVRVSR